MHYWLTICSSGGARIVIWTIVELGFMAGAPGQRKNNRALND